MFLKFKEASGNDYVVPKEQVKVLRLKDGELMVERKIYHLCPDEARRVATDLVGEVNEKDVLSEESHLKNSSAVKEELPDLDSLAKTIARDLQKLSSKDEIKKRAYIIECLTKEPDSLPFSFEHKDLIEYIHKMAIVYDQEIDEIMEDYDSETLLVKSILSKINVNTRAVNGLTPFFEKRLEVELDCKIENVPF